jgi:E3 ubiquitin-protein ligase BRE1
LQSTLFQLKTSQSNVAELQANLSKVKEKWAQSLGNEKSALAAVDDLISKFNKRWFEFSNGALTSSTPLDAEGIAAPLSEESPEVVMSKRISELQHKLNQALENVRQSELTRENLKVALAMNGSLQAKLDEVKGKYAALRTSQSSNEPGAVPTSLAPVTKNKESSVATPVAPASSTPTTSTSEPPPKASATAHGSRSDEDKIEKLKSQYRRARKDLAAMTVSRDSSKVKFERAEKERDSLMESNVRLLKQMSEKDEMNAKSLSTILHLKNMTEKLSEERDNLEQQMKSASQLALAARLATNAKERVSEEIVKEKKATEDRLQELEKQYQSMQAELERVSSEWSDASGKMAVKESELAYAWKRSDELAAENEVKREEIRKLVDLVNKAVRESREAKDKLAKAVKSSSGGDVNGDEAGSGGGGSLSSFSVEQLQTQISVLKNRLACPVCHYRDKECIILRCRHMHCKQCVDERISNRSRKCPTCNVKFSENEVGDVWLSG